MAGAGRRRLAMCAGGVVLVAGCGPSPSQPASATTAASPCSEGAAGELVATYEALLRTQQWSDARIFVSRAPVSMLVEHPPPSQPIDLAVMDCLAAGVTGLPRITVVEGQDDPALPTVPGRGGNIRALPEGPLITFGPLESDRTTSINVDTGAGNISGGEYRVITTDGVVSVVPTGTVWIS